MRRSVRQVRSAARTRGACHDDDPCDEIEMELLGLWLGVCLLRERLQGASKPPGKPAAHRRPRRKAA